MICCKLHLYSILWELVRAEHDTSVVSEKKSKPQNSLGDMIGCKYHYKKQHDYIKMLRGRPNERNLSAKALTDLSELRSSFKTSTLAVGVHCRMCRCTSSAAAMFLAAMMTWAPLRAKTLAVSAPIPLAPPGLHVDSKVNVNFWMSLLITDQLLDQIGGEDIKMTLKYLFRQIFI